MLQNFLIFSLFIVAIRASGELTLLNVPKSLTFRGNDALQSRYVGDLLYAITGNAVAGDAAWSGLVIDDPFNLPNRIVGVYVDGMRHLNINDNAKSYAIQGSDSEESLSVFSAQLQAGDSSVCNFNLKNFEEAKANYAQLFGSEIKLSTSDNKQVAFIENIANNWQKLQDDCEFFYIRAAIESVEENNAIGAAIAKLSAAIEQSTEKKTLMVAIANKAARAKRDTLAPATDGKNPYNLAKSYDEDYPAIFNIIFWFMIIFFLALLAICYALAYMDPGRDSIIYRMTSTRMKKDN